MIYNAAPSPDSVVIAEIDLHAAPQRINPALAMDETTSKRQIPPGWLDAIKERERKLEAGLTVAADEVMRELYESFARLKAQLISNKGRGGAPGL